MAERITIGSAGVAALVLLCFGCARPPPPSLFPTAEAAFERMRATYACSRGVSVEAKLDYIGSSGRGRGDVFYLAAVPDRVRFDVVSPFGATLSTLASNGERFTLADLRARQFLHGPANACNLARFTRVPLEPHALVDLLRGEAPVLAHRPGDASIAWEGGRYFVRIRGQHGANEVVELEPVDADFLRDWKLQRVRVLGIRVEQLGVPLYNVKLEAHAPARTAPTRVDPDGLDPAIPPSGPECSAELPRRIHIEVPAGDHDLVLALKSAVHNPPLVASVFEPEQPGGLRSVYSACQR